MKACASCSGGVMFVPDAIERGTNKKKSVSYKDIVGEDGAKKPLREKVFGLLFKDNKKSKAA